MSFFSRLSTSAQERKSLLCVGLDPRVPNGENIAEAIIETNRRVIEPTLRYAAAYKPNIAFYECHGLAGIEALITTLDMIPEDTPVILDAKRNDIGATAEAYAKGLFDFFGVDAVTLNAYMGKDSIEPFLRYSDRGLFLLCKTSNPGAADFQTLTVSEDGAEERLYLRIARTVCGWSDRIGLVVAGNDIESLAAVRLQLPEVWILAPGIGAQGGSIDEAIAAGIRGDGLGILTHVSRSIDGAADPGEAAREFCEKLNEARDRFLEKPAGHARPTGGPGRCARATGGPGRHMRAIRARATRATAGQGPATPAAGTHARAASVRDATNREAADHSTIAHRSGELKETLLDGLLDAGCFRLGEFVLKSGIVSPFYVDLRRIGSDPSLLRLAAGAYAQMSEHLVFDRIAGIPMAGLPLATALCLAIDKPLVIPRPERKDHGTGNAVEGEFNPGDRVLLLDDLITTGGAKLEAAEVLRASGLIVEDLVVLIERGTKGRNDMVEAGIKLHAFAHIEELLDVCERRNMLNRATRASIEAFLKG